jgi:hypothetical protein
VALEHADQSVRERRCRALPGDLDDPDRHDPVREIVTRSALMSARAATGRRF